MNILQDIKGRIAEYRQQRQIKSRAEGGFSEEVFHQRLEEADSPRTVRALWKQYAQQLSVDTQPQLRVRGTVRNLVKAVVEHTRAWDTRLARQVVKTLQDINISWKHGEKMARNPYLTPEAAEVMLDVGTKELFLKAKAQEEKLCNIIQILADRGLVPEKHPLRQKIIRKFKNEATPHVRRATLALGDISTKEVRERVGSLIQEGEDSIQLQNVSSRKPWIKQDIRDRTVEYLIYLCQHDREKFLTEWWGKLAQLDIDRAREVLQALPAERREQIDRKILETLLHHPQQQVRRKAMRMSGNFPHLPGEPEHLMGDFRPSAPIEKQYTLPRNLQQ